MKKILSICLFVLNFSFLIAQENNSDFNSKEEAFNFIKKISQDLIVDMYGNRPDEVIVGWNGDCNMLILIKQKNGKYYRYLYKSIVLSSAIKDSDENFVFPRLRGNIVKAYESSEKKPKKVNIASDLSKEHAFTSNTGEGIMGVPAYDFDIYNLGGGFYNYYNKETKDNFKKNYDHKFIEAWKYLIKECTK